MNFEELSPEIKAKARECATPQDILKLAGEQGYELSDEQLEAVCGGGFWDDCSDDCCVNCRSQAICWGAGG